MERMGLVGRVEEQLERAIARGMLPECGRFGSEQKLARNYGVSRGTVREALRRLAARGLVVQHPGRKTRAVALDESLTLENLGMALHDERSPGARRLLEGYFSLKRQVTVELLADCCAKASEESLDLLHGVCFELWNAARWESGARCAQLEFELLRLAARAVDRPGHLLLIQSLHRAFQGVAARVLPLMDSEALRQWACCAMDSLGERDPEALKRKLLPLLKDCDKLILGRLAPASEGTAAPDAEEERGLGHLAHASEEREVFKAHLIEEPLPVETNGDAPVPRVALGLNPGEPGGDSAEGDLPDAVFTNLSDCPTASCASRPEEGPQPEPPSTRCRGPAGGAVREETAPLHGSWGEYPPTFLLVGFAPHAPPLLAPEDGPPPDSRGAPGADPGGGGDGTPPQALPLLTGGG